MKLDDPLEPADMEIWSALLGVIIWLPAALDARLKPHGVSHSEFQVLWWLSLGDDGTRTMGDLAGDAGVTPSHLSRIAARLEKQGWVVRRPDPADARFTLASLTETGAAKVTACVPGYHAALREHLFDRLTDEQARQLGRFSSEILLSVNPACRHAIPDGPAAGS